MLKLGTRTPSAGTDVHGMSGNFPGGALPVTSGRVSVGSSAALFLANGAAKDATFGTQGASSASISQSVAQRRSSGGVRVVSFPREESIKNTGNSSPNSNVQDVTLGDPSTTGGSKGNG